MKLKLWFVAIATLSGLVTAGSAAAGDADFTLVNKTGYSIGSVFIAPTSAGDKVGDDRLGEGVLADGKSRLIKFSSRARCVQNIYVFFEDGSDAQWDDMNLCELNKITLKYNRKTRVVSADKE